MSPVVSLRQVADDVDVASSECTTYLNRKTGEVVFVSEEDLFLLDEDMDEADLPAWQAEMLPKLREATTSEDYLVFSIRDEFDEYRMMERFARSVEAREVSERLQRALQGRGAFRSFKDVAREHGLLDSWFEHRQCALEELVAEWLEQNGIEFTRP